MFFDSISFWIALACGFFLGYVLSPDPTVLYKYPTLENAGKVSYVDKSGVCYKYKIIEVDLRAVTPE